MSLKLLFLRGADVSNPLGQTDVLIAEELWKKGIDIETVLFGRHGVDSKLSLNAPGVRILVGESPPLRGLVTNLRTFRRTVPTRYDVVLASYELFPAAFMYKLRHRDVHVIVDLRSIPVGGTILARVPHILLLVWALTSSYVSGVTCITESMLEAVRRSLPSRKKVPWAVWGSGVDLVHFSPREPDRDLMQKLRLEGYSVVGYHGSLSSSRGIESLVDVAHLLINARKPVVFLIIGKGDAVAKVKAKAKEMQVEHSFRVLDAVSYHAMPRYLSVLDVGVVPHPDDWRWRHQQPLKLLEFLAMGKPVVATDLPCHRNVSRAVFLVPPSNPQVMAKRIEMLTNLDGSAQLELRDNARADAYAWSWGIQAERLKAFLDRWRHDGGE
jgi:glycosyltransferase involved in cell wall biosynthesis